MKTLSIPSILMAITCFFMAATTAQAAEFTTEQQKFSYAIGFQMGQNLKQNGIESIDAEALSQAITDVLSGSKLKVSQQDFSFFSGKHAWYHGPAAKNGGRT